MVRTMKKRISFLAACTFFAGSLLFSQTHTHEDPFFRDFISRNWNAESGLPANTITDEIQDRDGYMYFGTYSGLLRFDGVEFITMNRLYNENYDFLSARTIIQDTNQDIWVGTNDEGVICLKRNGVVEKYGVKDGLVNNSIRAFCEDKNGYIWIGTASGISTILHHIVENPVFFNEIPDDNRFIVNQLYCDNTGRVWIVTRTENGLYSYYNGRFEKSIPIKSIENPVITTVMQEEDGTFWFGVAPHYVVKVSDGKETVYDVGHGSQKGTAVTCIFKDSSKNIWFGTDNGITVLHNGMLSYPETSQLLAGESVTKIIEDLEHNIWFALDRGGIQKLSYGRFQTTNLPSTVNAIAQDTFRNVIWLGCDDGVRCYNEQDDILLENEITEFCKNIRVRHVGVTEEGALLVCCYGKYGQIKFNLDGNIEIWDKNSGIAGDKVRVAKQLSNGDLYIGTTMGLSIINQKTGEITNICKNDILENDFIMCVFEDTDGSVWFGTDGGGVYVLNPRTKEITKKYTKDNGLVGNIIFKISSEREGEIWICTGSGLSIITKDGDKIFNIDSNLGFGSDGVFQVMLDNANKVWCTTNQGISNIKLNEIDEARRGMRTSLHTFFYGKLDGITSGGVTSTSVSLKDDKGKMWFTLIDGFTVMDPARNAANNYAPTIKIQSLTLDSEKMDIPSDNRRKGYRVEVSPDVRRLIIKYTGISFVSSEQVQFRTKLEGFDNKFSDWTTDRTASFTNLKPGNYTFHVIARNADGVQSNTEATLIIVKKAHLWQKIWFKTVLSLIIVCVISVLVYLRFAAYRKRQKEIEKLSIEVTMALSQTIDAKDKYTKGHSNRVAKYSRMLAEALGEDEKTQEKIYYVALLHDIGKIGVPNAIINKPGKLTDEEYEIIKTHPVIGSDILKTISSMPEISIGARSHHERFDGRGYPDGLAGENIPWIARIIGVADAYDAMTSNRSYRSYLPQNVVRAEFVKCSGVQFDPRVADAMLSLIDADTNYTMHE